MEESNVNKIAAMSGNRVEQRKWLESEILELSKEEFLSDRWYLELCDVKGCIQLFDIYVDGESSLTMYQNFKVPRDVLVIWNLSQDARNRTKRAIIRNVSDASRHDIDVFNRGLASFYKHTN